MCGISAIIAKNTVKYSDLILLNKSIAHRGPDDEGYFILDAEQNINFYGGNSTPDNVYKSSVKYTPNSQNQNLDLPIKFGLAHRRLSILDLSELGHLPMSYSNRYWITYNGEVYNYIEIKGELINLGYTFNTETDTEVILASYQEWGADCVQKFIGMWALIIYDSETNNLFVSRDRFGIKPLYFHYTKDGDLFFGSEIKQFFKLENIDPQLNIPRALDFLNYGITDHTNETMFNNIMHFPASHYCKFNILHLPEKMEFVKYYSVNQDPFNGTLNQAESKFKELFDSSIELHLRSDVEIGSALSGGLDSTTIVSAINKKLLELGKTELQKTFSSCSEIDKYSEEKWIRIVQNELHLNSFYCYPNLYNLEKDLTELMYTLDEPSQSMSAFLGSNVFKLAHSKNVKVLINGQGADESLGGYGQFAILALIQNLKKLKIRSFYKSIQGIRIFRQLSYSDIVKGLLLHISKFKNFKTKNSGFLNISNEQIKKSIHPFKLYDNSNFTQNGIINNQIFKNALPRYLRWEDRNSMKFSIEARVPFLDHRLVDFVASLPVQYLENGGISKLLMRDSLSDYLPEKIKNRKDKKGFITPEEHWVKNENPQLFRMLLENSIKYSNGLINEKILDYFDNIVEGKVTFDYTYWRYIQFGYWMKTFGVKYGN